MMTDAPNPTDDRWQRIADLFWEAQELPAAERGAFLDRAAPDESLRAEVEAMLAAAGDDDGLRFEQRFVSSDAGDELPNGLESGTVIGPYRLEELVGRGGMGEVYRAVRQDEALTLTVALKLLRPDARTGGVARRFASERALLAQLDHPNIASIIDAGTAPDGRPFLVLRFVDGVPITQFAARLPVDDRIRLFLKVAHAVQFAHTRLIVHRDLKPGNILVTNDGQPVLLDFGIAKLLTPGDASVDETRAGERALTPSYAAPEQLRGEAITTATDVYALGALLFELLTGQHVFASLLGQREALERATLEALPSLPSAVAPTADVSRLRGDLDSIVLMALRKEPERRYRSAGELAADVMRYLDGLPVVARPDKWSYRTGRFVRRHRVGVAGMAAGALALVALFGREVAQRRRFAAERDRAVAEREAGDAVLSFVTGLLERSDPRVLPGGDTMRVKAFLDLASAQSAGLADQPERHVRLLRTLGTVRMSRGEYAAAESLLVRARQVGDSALGPDHLAVLQVRQTHAALVRDARDPALGGRMTDSVLSALRRTVGPTHPEVAEAYGHVAIGTDNPMRAAEYLDSLVAVRARLGKGDSVEIASLLDLRAAERGKRGFLLDAIALDQAALRILQQRFPADHPFVLAVTGNLSTWMGNAGRWSEALSLSERVLAVMQQRGDKGRAAALAVERVALQAVNLTERAAYADSMMRQARAAYVANLDPGHELIGSAMRNHAIMQAAAGNDVGALALMDSVVKHNASLPPTTGRIYIVAQRVPMLVRLGKLAEAERALAVARSVREAYPPGSSQYIEIGHWGGLVAFARGSVEEAVTAFSGNVEATRRLWPGIDHPRIALSDCALGAALVRAGRAPEGRPMLARCDVAARWGLVDRGVLRWGREAAR
ncbi:MAG: protein kinase [Gemmatimonadetes bacterium]|nr:protein kinase [Gemmatimonadota bacterium]